MKSRLLYALALSFFSVLNYAQTENINIGVKIPLKSEVLMKVDLYGYRCRKAIKKTKKQPIL